MSNKNIKIASHQLKLYEKDAEKLSNQEISECIKYNTNLYIGQIGSIQFDINRVEAIVYNHFPESEINNLKSAIAEYLFTEEYIVPIIVKYG